MLIKITSTVQIETEKWISIALYVTKNKFSNCFGRFEQINRFKLCKKLCVGNSKMSLQWNNNITHCKYKAIVVPFFVSICAIIIYLLLIVLNDKLLYLFNLEWNDFILQGNISILMKIYNIVNILHAPHSTFKCVLFSFV